MVAFKIVPNVGNDEEKARKLTKLKVFHCKTSKSSRAFWSGVCGTGDTPRMSNSRNGEVEVVSQRKNKEKNNGFQPFRGVFDIP